MKLKVLQENLSGAVSSASRLASPKAQLPVLGNLLLSARKEKLLISSTNLEISLSIAVGAKVETQGELTVPARVLNDLVSNLKDGQIDLESSKETLKVKTADFSSTISGMNASDFPEVPRTITNSMTFSGEEFVDALDKVLYAVSSDETRPVLTGVLMMLGDDLTMVSTDGFRLSRKKLKIKSKKKDSFILPKTALSEVSRLSNEDDVEFAFEKDDKQIIFGMNDTVLASRIIEGEFPDFDRIIPDDSKISVNVDKQEMDRAVRLASVFARESANVVKVTVNKDSLNFSAESSSSGSQEGSVDAKVDGLDKEMTIAFNYRFLEDLTGSIKGESVDINLNDPDSPGVFLDPEDKDFLHLIMPVKI